MIGSIVGALGSLGETAVHVIKLLAILAVCAVFLLAINALLGLLGGFVSTTVFGEIISLISMYLPFDAGAFFGTLLIVVNGILSFKVAKKIFDLTSWSISTV